MFEPTEEEKKKAEEEAREREKQDRLQAARNSGGLVSEAEVLADYEE